MNIEKFLELKDFNDFKTIGKRLIDINDLPQWFWDQATIPLNYNMLPDYCKLINDYRMRYIEINFDNDIVGIIFRVVQIVKTKQIRLFEIPFSKNYNLQNIKTIIQHLQQTLKEQFVLFSNIYDCGTLDYINCNYYYNYDYYNKKVDNKYRRKHRFSRYENNFSLKILSELNEEDKKTFINIESSWHNLKKDARSPQSFLHALKQKNENYLYYIGYLNNIPCICGIGVTNKFGIYIAFEYSLDRIDRLYDSIVIYTSKILSETLFKEYNIYNIYKLGARDKNKGLLQFKERTSKDKIKSYRININQLLDKLTN